MLDRKVVEKVKRKERKKEKRIVRTFLVRHRDNERGGGWGVKGRGRAVGKLGGSECVGERELNAGGL